LKSKNLRLPSTPELGVQRDVSPCGGSPDASLAITSLADADLLPGGTIVKVRLVVTSSMTRALRALERSVVLRHARIRADHIALLCYLQMWCDAADRDGRPPRRATSAARTMLSLSSIASVMNVRKAATSGR
jgi:hypothetical protein